jgi:hypothetical protein
LANVQIGDLLQVWRSGRFVVARPGGYGLSAFQRHSKIVIPAKAGIQAADLHGFDVARAVVGSAARHSGGEGVYPPAAS